ncbi:MAG: hypothetical protein R6U32_07410 [Candidatus Woesearchaeota archaeon]
MGLKKIGKNLWGKAAMGTGVLAAAAAMSSSPATAKTAEQEALDSLVERETKTRVEPNTTANTITNTTAGRIDLGNKINRRMDESINDKADEFRREYRPEISMPEIALNSAISYFMTVYTHELGHCAVAQAYGLDGIKVEFTMDSEKVAYSSYDEGADLSNDQKALLNAGGVLATRANYEALTFLMKKDKVPEKMKPFVSTFALFSRFDMPYQMMAGAREHFFDGENELLDYESFTDNVSEANDVSKDLVYGIIISAQVLDLYLDRDEIRSHFRTALGKEADFSKGQDKNLTFSAGFDGKKAEFNIRYEF